MDRNETLKIMAVLQAAYPNFYKGMKAESAEGIVILWNLSFADDQYELVSAAVLAHINTNINPFPPVISLIKNAIHTISHPQGMTEMEAWQRVKKSCSIYDYQQEFERLPPILQRMVGSPPQLREWAIMDADELETVVGSNFMRSYKVRAASQKEYEMLPESVRNVAIGLMPKMDMNLLGSGDDD